MAPAKSATVPSWMTKEFFVDAISKKFNVSEGSVTIEDVDVRPATESGDNFVSVMYRVQVNVLLKESVEPDQRRTVSLIVKALPSMGLSEEMILTMNVFPKESAMYTDILPAFEQLYSDRGVEVSFGPRCLKHCTEPTHIIVMEDLKELDFRMANRREGLDLEHCQVLLARLAQFHAASAVLHEKNGPYPDMFKEGMYAEKNRGMFEQFQKLHDAFMYETLCSWPNNGKLYAELMRHWGMDMFDALLRIIKPDPKKFNVLNHGDIWCNNMMFRYNQANQIDQITLVDFQMSTWSSPVIDLNYFLFSSVRADLKLRELDYLIGYYHRHLSENLTLLGYGGVRPSLKDLHSDFIARQLYGLSTAFSVLPICLMEKTEDASIDLMLDQGDAGTAFKQKMYNNPAFVEQMGSLLEHFHNTGAFDINELGVQRPAEIECDDSLDLPQWLDRKFFEDVVSHKLGPAASANDRTIRNVRLELATKKGDNYASVLYRARIEVQTRSTGTVESFSTVVKAPPKGVLADHMFYLHFSAREIQMYKHLLPALEQLYHERGVEVQFGPRCFKICEAIPADVLVLDDLLQSGTPNRMADRREGLDLHHTEVALDLLAKFHAASAVYVEQGNSLSEDFVGPKMMKNMNRMAKELFQPVLDNLIEFMADWDFAAEYYADLQRQAKGMFDELFGTFSATEEGFNVLNHGDLWINNMLFSYDSNGNCVSGVKFVDFQMSSWSSPMIDLHSFLFTSVRPELRLTKLSYFLRYYQEKLVDNLVLLGYRRRLPTLQQLHVDFNDSLLYGLSMVLVALPFLLVPDTSDASLDTIVASKTEAGQRFQKQFLDNDELKSQLKELLPFFRNRGIISQGGI